MMQSNPNRIKRLNRAAWLFSIVVFVVVLSMRRIKIDVDRDLSFLPMVYSTLNFITFCLLLVGYYLIRFKKNIEWHQRFMTYSAILSAFFLFLYVLYHITNPETPYCKVGTIRIIYLFLLITHIVFAALILPFILFTYIRAFTRQFERHRSMARWVFPVWLYVAITGPILFLMLWPCYSWT